MLLGAVPFGHQQLGLINRADVFRLTLFFCGTTGARSLGNYPLGTCSFPSGLAQQSASSEISLHRPWPRQTVSNVWGWPVAEDVEFQGALSLGFSRPGGGGGGPSVVPPGFLRWFLLGRQGVDLLCLARFSGFARLKLLAVRAFEFGVTGPVQRNLRLWAGLSSTPVLDGPRR